MVSYTHDVSVYSLFMDLTGDVRLVFSSLDDFEQSVLLIVRVIRT